MVAACGEQRTIEWQDPSDEFYCHGYQVGAKLALRDGPYLGFLPCNPPENTTDFETHICTGLADGYIDHKKLVPDTSWETLSEGVRDALITVCVEQRWRKNFVFLPEPLVYA